ncbi:MAG: class I SAM-dependent methyltransferase [Bdellovibrionota bacterium]
MTFGVFGSPLGTLATVSDHAVQFSPLFPGSLSLEDCAPGSLSGMIMQAPPGTIERRYSIALALKALQPGATLTVLAAKDKGGSRLAKELTQFGCEVSEEAKSHHRICVCSPPKDLSLLDAAVADGAPRFLEEQGLWTQPGVFSWDRKDAGSALLLEHLPKLSGRGADLGAGIGYLTREILRSPDVQHMTLLEIDSRAVKAAKKNLDDPRVTILWADLRQAKLKAGSLDFVITNPPFHDGGTEDQSLGQEFLRFSAEVLKPGGVCWLVANRHLPYEAILKTAFKHVALVTESTGFKIYEAKK